jgi:hypothetical protein
MRLPWPFGRARPDADATAPAGAIASGDGANAAASTGLAGRGGGAWRSLPPLAETIGPPPVVAPAKPFAASLAADNPPPPILARLSHGRGLEAPSGIVVGVAKPVAVSHGAAVPAPVQRSPSRAASPGAVPGPATEARDAEAAASMPPLPRLPIAGDAPAVAARSLVTGGGEGISAPRGRVLPPRATGEGRARTAIGVQRAPEAPATPKPPAQLAPVGSTPAPLKPPATLPRSDNESGRMTLGQARRLGLGAPIAGGAIGTFDGGGRPAPASAPAMPLVPRAPETPAAEPAHPETASTAEPIAAAAPMPIARIPNASAGSSSSDAPGAPAASGRSATSEPGARAPDHGPLAAAFAPAAAPAPIQRSHASSVSSPSLARPRRAAREDAPLTSARPLRTGVQRAPLTIPSREPAGARAGVPGVGPVGDAPVRIHRDQSAGDLAKALDARSFTHGGEIFLPSSHGPLTSGTGRSLLAHELTHVAQQRRLGSSLPDESSPRGRSLEAEAVAAERSPMSLASRPSGHEGHNHESGGGATSEGTSPPTSGAMRAESPDQGSRVRGSSALDLGPVQRAASTPPQSKAPTGPAGRSYTEPELEDLAGRLYARIGRRLRRELLVDRERAGLAVDLG